MEGGERGEVVRTGRGGREGGKEVGKEGGKESFEREEHFYYDKTFVARESGQG